MSLNYDTKTQNSCLSVSRRAWQQQRVHGVTCMQECVRVHVCACMLL
jgi:hypothetical protein